MTRATRHWLVFLLLLVATFLRFFEIGQSSLWTDELWSIEIASGRGSLHDHLPTGVVENEPINFTTLDDAPPWWKIWTSLAGVTHPPLYHVVLRWWMDIFGAGPAATRSLSAVFSLASLLVFFDVCRRLHGPRIALLAMTIMTLAIPQIVFAQEARSYAMLTFLGLASADLLIVMEQSRATAIRIGILAITLTATVLTHYFGLFAFASLGLYALIRQGRRNRVRIGAAFILAGCIVLAAWGPWAWAQLHSLPSLSPGFLQESPGAHPRATLGRLIELPTRLLLGDGGAMNLVAGGAGFVEWIVAGLLVAQIFRLASRPDLLFWVIWTFGTIGAISTLDLLHQSTLLSFLRYTILAGPGVYALLAGVNAPRRGSLRDGMAFLTLAILAAINLQGLTQPIVSEQDYRGLAQQLDQHAGRDDLLVFQSRDPWLGPGIPYLALRYYQPTSNHPWLLLNQPADLAVQRQLNVFQSIWLVDPKNEKPSQLLPGWEVIDTQEFQSIGRIDHLRRRNTR